MSQSGRSHTSSITLKNPMPIDPFLIHPLRCQAKISSLAFNLGSLSTLPSATEETLFLISLPNFNFSFYHKQIITLAELARQTLQSSKVVPYLWAACPKEVLVHKMLYIDLLKVLQKNQNYVDIKYQRRLRVLLMPLTSHFRISKSGGSDDQSSLFSLSSTQYARTDESPSASQPHEASSPTMLPPDGSARSSTYTQEVPSRRPRARRLWHVSELSQSSGARKHAVRTPSQHRLSSSSSPVNEDVIPDQENVAPEPVPFRQAPRTQRFGIFMSRKPTLIGGYKRGSRNGRPTH